MRIPAKVEIGFGSTWRTEPSEIAWTDVTEFVLDRRSDVHITRGATAAWGETDPGELSLTLLNRDRRFDPEEPSSPYAGQLVAGVPIRLLAAPTGDDWLPLFTGFVAGWPQRFDRRDGFHVVPIHAVDGFEKLATARLSRSYLETRLGPYPYFPMGDATYEWESINAPRTGRYTAQPSRSEIVTDTGAAHVATQFDGRYLARFPAWTEGAVALVDVDPSVETGTFLTLFDRAGREQPGDPSLPPPLIQIWVGVEIVSASRREARVVLRRAPFPASSVHGEPNPWSVRVSAPFTFAEPFTIGWSIYNIGSGWGHVLVVYLNGVPVQMSFAPDLYEWAASFDRQITVGGSPRPGGLWAGWQGRVAHVLLLPRNVDGTSSVTDAIVADHHAAVFGALDQQRTGERLGWVLDQVDWPAGARNIAEGRTRVGPVNPAERLALDYARLVDATEAGRMFIAADGTFTFHDRWRRWLDDTATAPQLNLTGSTGVYFQDLDRDPQSTSLMANRASVSRENGRSQVRRNEGSVDRHGEHGVSVDTIHRSDLGARGLASFIVGTRGEPLDLIDMVRVPLHGAPPGDAAVALTLELGDRVRVTHESRGIGDPIVKDGIVEGVRHSITGAGTEWWCELNLAPVVNRSPFIIGESLVGGPDVVTY